MVKKCSSNIVLIGQWVVGVLVLHAEDWGLIPGTHWPPEHKTKQSLAWTGLPTPQKYRKEIQGEGEEKGKGRE